MAIPEFISVLRKIRDVIYPEVNAVYEDSLVLKESIDVGKAEFDADFAQFNTDYDTFIIQKNHKLMHRFYQLHKVRQVHHKVH